MRADRQTDTETYRESDRNTPHHTGKSNTIIKTKQIISCPSRTGKTKKRKRLLQNGYVMDTELGPKLKLKRQVCCQT